VLAGGVKAEVFASGSVCADAARSRMDEAGVLIGPGGDMDVVIGLPPSERL